MSGNIAQSFTMFQFTRSLFLRWWPAEPVQPEFRCDGLFVLNRFQRRSAIGVTVIRRRRKCPAEWTFTLCVVAEDASLRGSLQPRIQIEELFTPVVVIQQAGRVAFEKS